MSGAFSDPPALVVSQLVIDLGLGTDPDTDDVWPVYHSKMPDGPGVPNNAITVYETTPRLQGRIMFDGETQENHGIQVRVRADGAVTGQGKARAIQRAFDVDVSRTTVIVGANEYLVHCINRLGGILPLGTETPEGRRELFTLNVLAVMRQTS